MQVAASFAAEGASMNELKQWNELYGEGGSRKKQQLAYFLWDDRTHNRGSFCP